jgi:hypothetical protein
VNWPALAVAASVVLAVSVLVAVLVVRWWRAGDGEWEPPGPHWCDRPARWRRREGRVWCCPECGRRYLWDGSDWIRL